MFILSLLEIAGFMAIPRGPIVKLLLKYQFNLRVSGHKVVILPDEVSHVHDFEGSDGKSYSMYVDPVDNRTCIGTVMTRGPKVAHLKAGHRVIFNRFKGTTYTTGLYGVERNSQTYVILEDDDIYCIIERKSKCSQ